MAEWVLMRTPAMVSRCYPHCAHPGSRKQRSYLLSRSLHSVCSVDVNFSPDGDLARIRDFRKRGSCQAAAVTLWTTTPLAWLKSQFSKGMWAHISSSLCTLMAYIICMMVPLMLGIVLCIWRFHVREEQRSIAQAQRRQEGIHWVGHKIRRAIVLGQDISQLRLVDTPLLKAGNIVSREAENRLLASYHARSLACTANPGARIHHHITGRMLCTSFRAFATDNWRRKATADALYKAVHKGMETAPGVTEPVPVAQESHADGLKTPQRVEFQVARQFYACDGSGPKAGESELARGLRVKRMLKLSDSQNKWMKRL